MKFAVHEQNDGALLKVAVSAPEFQGNGEQWFDVYINVKHLVNELGRKALANKSGKAREAGGAIIIEVVT